MDTQAAIVKKVDAPLVELLIDGKPPIDGDEIQYETDLYNDTFVYLNGVSIDPQRVQIIINLNT